MSLSIKRCVSFVYPGIPRDSSSNINAYDKETLEGPSPSEEDNSVVVEPISLDKRHSIESYVLDVVDPLTQSTQLGIDLYIQALDLIRDRME